MRQAHQDSNGKWAKFGCEAFSKGCTIVHQYKGDVQNRETKHTVYGSLRRSICANALKRAKVRLEIRGTARARTGNSFANADLLPVMTTVPERRLLMWGNTA